MHLSDKGWCSNGTRSATTEKLKAWIPYSQGRCFSQALLRTNLIPTGSLGDPICVGDRRLLSTRHVGTQARTKRVCSESYSDRTTGAVSALGSLTTKSVGCLLS